MDIEEAYRIVPVHPDDRHLLGCQSVSQVYIDIAQPFGLRSAPIIFMALADGLQWIIKQRGAYHVAHYLDDFITVWAPKRDQCYVNQQIIFETCQELGILLTRLEHIMLFFLPIILFHNSSYFNLLFPYYHPIILMSQCIKLMM